MISIETLIKRTLGDISTDLRGLIIPRYYSSLVLSHRADLIVGRVRLIAFLIALLTPLWCVADQFFMPRTVLWQLCAGRFLTATAFILLALLCHNTDRHQRAYLALGALYLIPTLFFIYAGTLLNDIDVDGVAVSLVTGYQLLPFLMAAGLSIFPLTALEGSLFALLVIVVQWMSTAMSSVEQFGQLWIVVLIAVVAVLSGMTQLHYLSEIVTLSAHDALTNAYNRLTGEEFMGKYLSLARRNASPFSVVFLDLDNFKAINDDYGHEAGDQLLVQLCGRISSQLRKEDSLIRWGGEEFLLALPMADRAACAEVIARIGREGLGLRPDGTALTASVGAACTIEDEITEISHLIQLADERMYLAKQRGKNRYCDGSKSDSQQMAPFIKIGA